MGVGCCKLNDIQEILVSHNELKILVELNKNGIKLNIKNFTVQKLVENLKGKFNNDICN